MRLQIIYHQPIKPYTTFSNMTGTPRLTKNSRARQVLKEKLEKGDLDGSEAPKTVWASDPLFKAHTLDAFRTCYNNVKSELGITPENGTY